MAALRRLAPAAVALWAAAACAGPQPGLEELGPPAAPGPEAADPVLAIDPASGDVLLAWTAGAEDAWQLYAARSTDGGATWSAPVRVTDQAGDVHPHAEASPRLAVAPGGGTIALVWTRSIPVAGRRWPASDIRVARSTDGGRSWTAALTLNDDTASGPAGHTFHGTAWQDDSTLLVAWLDERGGAAPGDSTGAAHAGHHPADSGEADATVYLAVSRDGGRRWAPNRPLWGAVCPCCRISLARGPTGEVLAAWRKHFPGNVRDVVVTPIADHAAETRVHADDWVYPGCPHTGPGVAVAPDGATHVVWYTGKPGAAAVLYARRTGTDEFASPSVLLRQSTLPTAHPRVAPLPGGGAVVAWDIAPDRRAALQVAVLSPAGRVVGRTEAPRSAGADHPEIVTVGEGALVAWAERDSTGSRIRMARVKP